MSMIDMSGGNKHIREIAEESGVDYISYRSHETKGVIDGVEYEIWYDEDSSSPFAWKAFIKGYGTSSGLSPDDALGSEIKYKERQDNKNAETIPVTIGEIHTRWGMSDLVCNILGLNPWCLNEGLATKETVIQVSRVNATKIGIMKYEFDARRK